MKGSKWSFDVQLNLHDWALGWVGSFAFMGIGVLCIGPLAVTVTWPIAEETSAVASGGWPYGLALGSVACLLLA